MNAEHSKHEHRQGTVKSYQEILGSVREFAQRNFSRTDVTLDDYALVSGYSRRQVQRALSWFGTSWRAVLSEERMKQAKELLRTKKSWDQIALLIGYQSTERALEAFKRSEGQTPDQYRESTNG